MQGSHSCTNLPKIRSLSTIHCTCIYYNYNNSRNRILYGAFLPAQLRRSLTGRWLIAAMCSVYTCHTSHASNAMHALCLFPGCCWNICSLAAAGIFVQWTLSPLAVRPYRVGACGPTNAFHPYVTNPDPTYPPPTHAARGLVLMYICRSS